MFFWCLSRSAGRPNALAPHPGQRHWYWFGLVDVDADTLAACAVAEEEADEEAARDEDGADAGTLSASIVMVVSEGEMS